MTQYFVLDSCGKKSEPLSSLEDAITIKDTYEDKAYFFNYKLNDSIFILAEREDGSFKCTYQSSLNQEGDRLFWFENDNRGLSSLFEIQSLFSHNESILFSVKEYETVFGPNEAMFIYYLNSAGFRKSIFKGSVNNAISLDNISRETHYVDSFKLVETFLEKLWQVRLNKTNQMIEVLKNQLLKLENSKTTFLELFNLDKKKINRLMPHLIPSNATDIFFQLFIHKTGADLEGNSYLVKKEQTIPTGELPNLTDRQFEAFLIQPSTEERSYRGSFVFTQEEVDTGIKIVENNQEIHNYRGWTVFMDIRFFLDNANPQQYYNSITSKIALGLSETLANMYKEKDFLSEPFSYSRILQKLITDEV